MVVVTGPRTTRSATRRLRAGVVLLAAACVLFAAFARVDAASPPASVGPEASQSEEPHGVALQVWLDEPIPADAKVGDRVDVGATIWDPIAGELAPTSGSYFRIHPATGSATPEEAPTRSDWPGHLVASVRIPEGGPGRVEVGFEAEECRDDGGCQMVDVPFATGGVGPPPGAPRSLLVVAGFQPFAEAAVAGVPLALEVAVSPRAHWPPELLGLPDRLVVTATRLRGPQLATTDVQATRTGGLYAGTLVVPEPGETVLQVGIPGAGPDPAMIPTSTTRIQVEPPAATDDPAPGAPADPPPWPWIALGLAVAVAGAVVIRKAFADL